MKATIVFWLFVVLHACIIFPSTGQTTPLLKFQSGNVWAIGIGVTSLREDQWIAIFRVYTQEAFDKRVNQPIAGTYTQHGDSLSFTPDFSFIAGGNYHALFGKQELVFSIP